MIAIVLHDMRWRIALLLPLSAVLYALEPGFHQHEGFDPAAINLGPVGVSATLSYFAGLSMIVLLGGFVSSDRREGHTRLLFAHPTSPIAYYGLRWAIAYVISVTAAFLFLVLGQLIAWGEVLGGWSGMILPILSALVYGGLVSFFSVVLPRGDTWVAFLFFLPTFLPQMLSLALSTAAPPVRQTITLLLPPQGAFQQIWDGLLFQTFEWGAVIYAAAYGFILLISAAALLTLLEWP